VSGSSGGRENNLAFKCTKKRLVFETHHLDVEGGVGERRTVPAGNIDREKATSTSRSRKQLSRGGGAAMEVELEGEPEESGAAAAEEILTGSLTKRKKVTFQAEQRDLYDF
jgi:elongator complex protein 4